VPFSIAFQRNEKLPVRHVLIVPSRLALRSDSEADATRARMTAGHTPSAPKNNESLSKELPSSFPKTKHCANWPIENGKGNAMCKFCDPVPAFVSEALAAKKVAAVGGIYDLATGKVSLI
jgi:hypothetical protein